MAPRGRTPQQRRASPYAYDSIQPLGLGYFRTGDAPQPL